MTTLTLPQIGAPTEARSKALRLPKRFAPLEARELADRLAELRNRFRFASILTPPDANLKLARDGAAAALTLAPAATSGLEVCPHRSDACSRACVLWNAGHGRRSSVRDARIGRTLAIAEDPQAMLSGIVIEAHRLARAATPIRGLRLNCASDLPWERIEGFLDALPKGIALYDYTKVAARVGELGQAKGATRPYRLAFSISERAGSVESALAVLERGGSAVLVVAGARRRGAGGAYRYHPTPDAVRIAGRWYPAVSGDRSDRRDRDPFGSVVVLVGKGPLELPSTGGERVGDRFALRVDSPDLHYKRGLRRGF